MSVLTTHYKQLGMQLHQIAATQEDWSKENFGPATARGPQGPSAHLKKEANELADDPYNLEEAADCFILLMDINWRAGRTIEQLLYAVQRKQKVNRNRKWQKPGQDGAIEHVRD